MFFTERERSSPIGLPEQQLMEGYSGSAETDGPISDIRSIYSAIKSDDSEVLNIHESLSGSFFYFTFILVVATQCSKNILATAGFRIVVLF